MSPSTSAGDLSIVLSTTIGLFSSYSVSALKSALLTSMAWLLSLKTIGVLSMAPLKCFCICLDSMESWLTLISTSLCFWSSWSTSGGEFIRSVSLEGDSILNFSLAVSYMALSSRSVFWLWLNLDRFLFAILPYELALMWLSPWLFFLLNTKIPCLSLSWLIINLFSFNVLFKLQVHTRCSLPWLLVYGSLECCLSFKFMTCSLLDRTVKVLFSYSLFTVLFYFFSPRSKVWDCGAVLLFKRDLSSWFMTVFKV